MIGEIKRIDYRWGLLKAGETPDGLPIKSWSGPEIPAAIRKALQEEGILDLVLPGRKRRHIGGLCFPLTTGRSLRVDRLYGRFIVHLHSCVNFRKQVLEGR